jgi:hypothetical protein
VPRTGWLAALLLSTALALTGCGSGSLSTPALRKRATQICRIAVRRENRITTPTGAAQGPAFLRKGAAAMTLELRALRGLHADGQAAPVYARALTAVSGELAALRAGTHALTRGDDAVTEIRAVQSTLAPLEQRADAAWYALEIPVCTTS